MGLNSWSSFSCFPGAEMSSVCYYTQLQICSKCFLVFIAAYVNGYDWYFCSIVWFNYREFTLMRCIMVISISEMRELELGNVRCLMFRGWLMAEPNRTSDFKIHTCACSVLPRSWAKPSVSLRRTWNVHSHALSAQKAQLSKRESCLLMAPVATVSQPTEERRERYTDLPRFCATLSQKLTASPCSILSSELRSKWRRKIYNFYFEM